MNCSPFVIGVAGGTGSGKTTLATKLQQAIASDSIILSHDFYYQANTDIPFEERLKVNYDHPNTFDTDLMIEDIKKLKSGHAIDHPHYSFVTYTRMSDCVHVEPAPVIIVEGILIFENKELLDLMDIKVFVDADPPAPSGTSAHTRPQICSSCNDYAWRFAGPAASRHALADKRAERGAGWPAETCTPAP